jgi:hypothetical protein
MSNKKGLYSHPPLELLKVAKQYCKRGLVCFDHFEIEFDTPLGNLIFYGDP